MNGLRGDWKKLAKSAVAQGWRVVMTRSQHFKWYAPDNKTLLVSGLSTSDHRAIANHRAAMRRAGFNDRA